MIEVEVSDDIDLDSEEGQRVLNDLGVSMGVGDIADAFHRFRIDEFFSSFFGLNDILTSDLNLTGRDLGWGPLEAHSPLTHCFTSLSMGFTWSLYFCQVTGEYEVSRTSEMEHSIGMHDKGGSLIARQSSGSC